ncbi:hypothetical protein [Lysinibacillus telephonicus]|uniref:hypothetical protein n=1 Tax=Lysinibacillus telephonicus TaxID=1714840 RepID=UPI003BA1CE5D
MKKIMVLFTACMLLVPSLAKAEAKDESSNQGEGFSIPEEIVEMNEALDELVDQANQKLEDGETNFVIEEEVNGEIIRFGFVAEETTPISSDSNTSNNFTTYATEQTKTFYAYVENTAGFNFKHVLGGTFKYSGGKIISATTDVRLTGAFYSESAKTWVDEFDPSIWIAYSHGTFKALKYGLEYNTYLTVNMLGSGDYRITRAEISF